MYQFMSVVFAVSMLFPSVLAASSDAGPRPVSRPVIEPVPVARWDFRDEGRTWSTAAMRALRTHGAALVDETPRDIETWCPAYDDAPDGQRRAFWVGFLSALAKHESTWRPRAVGGDGLWYGLLQILPATARGYGCDARSGEALKTGSANLSCAIRIMSVTVPRDGVIHARTPKWGGVSADWGPMRSTEKRSEMATWLRRQPYCSETGPRRPEARPAFVTASTVANSLGPRERTAGLADRALAEMIISEARRGGTEVAVVHGMPDAALSLSDPRRSMSPPAIDKAARDRTVQRAPLAMAPARSVRPAVRPGMSSRITVRR